MLTDLYSALMGWSNTGVSLHAVFTVQNASCNKICFACCISPRLLGGYVGNRLSSVGRALQLWILGLASNLGIGSMKPHLLPVLLIWLAIMEANSLGWWAAKSEMTTKRRRRWSSWWNGADDCCLLACLCLQLLQQPVPGGPSPILSKQAAISVMSMLMS